MKRIAILLVALAGAILMAEHNGGPTMAQTAYIEHFLIFVEADKVTTANNAAAQWDPDTGGAETFKTVRLSPTGEEPVTHYAASTPATANMRNGITNALGNAAWATMYRTDDVTVDVPHWTGPDGWTFDGGVYAAWLSALEDMGLQRIQPEGL